MKNFLKIKDHHILIANDMKNTELRIGNYLNTKDGKLAIVEKITKDDFIAYSGMITKLPLSPIPLTEEWLLKFGFEKDIYTYGNTFLKDNFELVKPFSCDYYSYSVLSRNDDGINEPNLNIEYVHQLQNIFHALTGEELKIT